MDADRAVHDLVARSCDAVARADVDAWAACWRDDGEWIFAGREPIVGVARLRAAFATPRAELDLCVQEILSGWVEVDGDTASARWYLRETQRSADGGRELVGCYDDVVVRDDRGWRFSRRRFWVLYRGGRDLDGEVFRPPPPAGP